MYKFCQALTPLDQIRNVDVLCDVCGNSCVEAPKMFSHFNTHFLDFYLVKMNHTGAKLID